MKMYILFSFVIWQILTKYGFSQYITILTKFDILKIFRNFEKI